MKRFLPILALVFIFAVGCQADSNIDNTENSNTTLSVSLPTTRTGFGEKVGNVYSICWSEGDKIAVNGTPSEGIEINSEDSSCAIFTLGTQFVYPISVVYPYCVSTTAEQPIVEFPAEQEYVKGSFASGSAPMCGYAETASGTITMKHLAGVLRFPVKAMDEGVVLDKIVITAKNSIAGEFNVDCQNTTITPTQKVGKVVTYTFPANFTLSTTAESVFYISLPAVDTGVCTINFVEKNGKNMVATWTPNKPISKGVVREFSTIIYGQKTDVVLQTLETENNEFEIYYSTVYGYVKYSDGTPISGVAVSDGFNITKTNSKGYYKLSNVTPETWYIYCSMPNDVKIPINEFGRPDFYKKYPSTSPQYDFTFEKLPNGAEEEFYIIAMADTQPKDSLVIERFRVQAAPEIKSYTKGLGLPCYGVVLGDVVNSRPYLMEPMREELRYEKLDVPVFTVMGNHDHVASSKFEPLLPDERNSDFYIKIQRGFEECFGPVNYSYNRGDVHIVGMRDIINTMNYGMGDYKLGFTEWQYNWLKQDLALVPKTKTVVLCLHIPLQNQGKKGDGTYRQEVLELLNGYAEAHILAGHTHTMYPYNHKHEGSPWTNIYEHTIAATRYDMPDSNIHRDGTPCGYEVLKVVNGGHFVDWYYKGFPHGMNTRDYQMRLYRGGTIIGKEPEGGTTNELSTTGYYKMPFNNKTILANIFTSDPSWTVKISINGGSTWNTMTSFYDVKGSEYSDLTGDGTYNNPMSTSKECSRDFWAIGILFGHLGSEVNNNYNKCRTMWKYTSTSTIDPKKVIVRATDSHSGYVYECSKVEDGVDLGFALYDPQYNLPIE